MITKAHFRNFKCLRDVGIDLERFTVIVGPNASGKSSILQATDLLCRAFQQPGHDSRPKLAQSLSRGSIGTVEIDGLSGEWWFRYGTKTHFVARVTSDEDELKWEEWKPGKTGPSQLPRSVLLRLEVSKLVVATPASDATTMSVDGTGLHSALAGMALNDPDSWQTLQADLRKIIPTVRRLRHTKPANVNAPSELLFDTVGGDSLPANQVSEGTLLVLGMLAALHASGRPNLVLLDDLDRGLHPKAQKNFIVLLRHLMEVNADLQIVATTHSPYMLDCMEMNEVRMTFLREDGSTVCAPLSSHPKFEQWKDEMTPGELWSLFGEHWMVEQEVAG